MTPATKRRLLALHRWLGVHFAVLLVLICATGTLAVLGHDINWLIDPASRAPDAAMNWEAIDETLRRELPAHEIDSVGVPPSAGHAAVAFGHSETGQMQRILLDPGTGRLLGVRHAMSPQIYLRQVHKSFLVPGGVYLVGLVGLVLLYALVSGLLVYTRWWTKLTRWRLRAKPSIRWADVHRTGGVWLTGFAAIIAVTASWYLVEQVGYDAAGWMADAPTPERPERVDDDVPLEPIGTAEAIDAATQALPGFEPTMVAFGHDAGETLSVFGRLDTPLLRDYANRVHIDPYTAQVVGVRRADETGALSQFSNLADELHFGSLGDYGGLWSRLLYAACGVLLCVVAIAGPRLALARRRAAPRRPAPKGSAPVRVARALVLALTVLATVGVVALSWLGQSNPILAGRGASTLLSASKSHHGARYRLEAVAHGESAVYVLRWELGPPPHLREAVVVVDETTEKPLFGRTQAEAFTTLTTHPRVRLEDSSGESTTVDFVLEDAPQAAPGPFATVPMSARELGFAWGVVVGFVALACAVGGWLWRPLRAV